MKQFGLIGFPLGHSFSKLFFTEKFEKEGIDAVYDLFPLEEIGQFVELIHDHELTGLNVTIPYKQQVMQYLDELDETAAEIGAVNVIKFIRKDNKLTLKGFNSDAIGFENSLIPFLKPQYKHALVLGTGGASKAIFYVLKKMGIEPVYVSRTAGPGILSYEDLNRDIMMKNKLIVNCTPAGMFPNVDACPDIPYNFITNDHLLYDVIYKPDETLFMKKGKEMGATTVNGLEMLYGQAKAAWVIWNQ
jgi:shikimate dehydrogenase